VIELYINGKKVEEHNVVPDMTVLRYLRTTKNLPGTKEGCGSGDCGACSVLAGDMVNGEWRYKAINSCITFLSQLHNKSLITVEGLSQGSQLHPAQQAMVDKHGSQCGFCTPGIVMSLTALFENAPPNADFSLHEVYDALSGNLCRCTGYKPIIDAANAMKNYPGTIDVTIWTPTAERPVNDGGSDHSEGQAWTPKTEEALKQLLNDYPDVRLVAGATDLALEVTQMHRRIHKLVAINQIASLKTITETRDYLVIGGAATFTEIEPFLKGSFPEFAALMSRFASRQIKNSATMGGNIASASPIGDAPPVLIALNAEIEISSLSGSRWVALDTFYIDYKKTILGTGEYIRAIRIPHRKTTEQLKVYKISKRIEDDISAVLMAINITQQGDKIAAVRTGFGGMAAIPKAGAAIEAALLNQPMNVNTFRQAGLKVSEDFQPFNDVRASANYRIQVTQGLLEKCALEMLNPQATSRVENVCTAKLHSDNVIGPSAQECV
jgi:xanthine dehydrogenase small subunit